MKTCASFVGDVGCWERGPCDESDRVESGEDVSAAGALHWTIFFLWLLDEQPWSRYHIGGEETHMHKWGPLCATL